MRLPSAASPAPRMEPALSFFNHSMLTEHVTRPGGEVNGPYWPHLIFLVNSLNVDFVPSSLF